MLRGKTLLALALLVALWITVCAWLGCTAPIAAPAPDAPAAPVSVAFWPLIGAIVGAIWTGIQAAGRVTLAFLAWSVKALWAFAIAAYNGLKAAGVVLARGARVAWHFFRETYEHVLKPAWLKFWSFVDRVHRWLEHAFAPVLRWLNTLRTWVLAFYRTYVRPVLDVIDAARRGLRVLAGLGLEWAQALDRQLAELQDRIQRPFDELLAQINRVINTVNRIVDANGLFQRLTLLRSIARDAYDAVGTLVNEFDEPLTDAERDALRALATRRSIADVRDDTRTYLTTGGGAYAARVDALVRRMRPHLTAR